MRDRRGVRILAAILAALTLALAGCSSSTPAPAATPARATTTATSAARPVASTSARPTASTPRAVRRPPSPARAPAAQRPARRRPRAAPAPSRAAAAADPARHRRRRAPGRLRGRPAQHRPEQLPAHLRRRQRLQLDGDHHRVPALKSRQLAFGVGWKTPAASNECRAGVRAPTCERLGRLPGGETRVYGGFIPVHRRGGQPLEPGKAARRDLDPLAARSPRRRRGHLARRQGRAGDARRALPALPRRGDAFHPPRGAPNP